MKIILATPIYPPEIGGPAIYSQRLKEGLEKAGNPVKIASYQGLKKYPQPLRIFLYFLTLFKNTKNYTLIYAFNLISCGLPACCVSKISGKRFFLRIGGDFLWERAVEAGRTQKPLREYYKDPKTVKEKFWIWLMKKIFAGADKIIFTSDFQRDIYLQYFKVPSEKTIIIQNPFPDVGAEVPLYNIQDTKYQILYAGRLLKLKNLGLLIRAFNRVSPKNGKSLTLKIIGDGPEKDNLEISDKITIEKPLSQPDLLKEIQRSYLCVLPSLTEITPNFALECLKLRKPIILTKETGYYDIFRDGLIFIDPQSEVDLEEKIIYLLDERNYLNYIERIKKISTQRSWKDVIQEHEKGFIHRSH